jgi:hypothetical protein
MAMVHVQEYKKYRNEDSEGEGFDFCAAENMMTPWEYEQWLIYDHVPQFMDRLLELSESEQREYIRKLIAGERIDPLYDKAD